MSYANMDSVPTQTAGTSELLASDWNTYVRDNFDSIKFGHIVCTSSTRPTGIAEGTMIYETDTNKVLVYDGSSWIEINDLDTTNKVSTSAQGVLDDIGTVHLNTSTLSAVSSVSVDSVFSSTYANYLIMFSGSTTNGGSTFGLRLRSGGSDNANTYFWQEMYAENTSVLAGRTSGTGGWRVGATDANKYHSIRIYLFAPNETTYTRFLSNQSRNDGTIMEFESGFHDQLAAYDGYKLSVGAGSITGTVRVYGLRAS